MKTAVLVLFAVFLLGAAALGIWTWIGTLQEVNEQETDPKERKKWWLRVFFLRLIGVLWYDSHRRNQAAARDVEGPHRSA